MKVYELDVLIPKNGLNTGENYIDASSKGFDVIASFESTPNEIIKWTSWGDVRKILLHDLNKFSKVSYMKSSQFNEFTKSIIEHTEDELLIKLQTNPLYLLYWFDYCSGEIVNKNKADENDDFVRLGNNKYEFSVNLPVKLLINFIIE